MTIHAGQRRLGNRITKRRELLRRGGIRIVLAFFAAAPFLLVPLGTSASPALAAVRCLRADRAEKVIKPLYPVANTVGFKSRSLIEQADRRHPYWPGWCSNWYASYSGYQGRSPYAYAEVMVSLYDSHRHALAAFNEAATPSWTLPSGVRIRRSAGVGAAWVQSLVRNVVISSGDSGPDGPPDIDSAREAVRALTRIHRHMHAAVLLR